MIHTSRTLDVDAIRKDFPVLGRILPNGKPLSPPAVHAVPVYPLTVEGEQVLVDVDSPL